MRLRKRRIEYLLCAGLLVFSMETGYYGSTVYAQTSVESTVYANTTVTAKVESMDGTKVTAVIGKITESPMGMPPGAGQTSTDSSEAPSMPGGLAPGGMGGFKTFVASDEEITFSIADVNDVTIEYAQGETKGTIDDIVVNSILEVEFGDDDTVNAITIKNLQSGGGFGGSTEVTNGTAANTIDTDSTVSYLTYTSSGDDENALRIDGSAATLNGITVDKTGGESSNTENGDFYGQNAGLLVLNGATANIDNAYVHTNAVNGNGVFSYGEGTTVNISNSVIRTSKRNSGGIQTTGGGTTNATNLDVVTDGDSSAAIRSDRGGGTVNVTGGTFITNGTGSPAIYSTADINVKSASLTANNSEGIVVEGFNSVSLEDCNLTGNMAGTYGGNSSENIHNIMLYQSMSGDAQIGNSSFDAEGGSITCNAGDMFYVTNTTSEIHLTDVDLTLSDGTLLTVAGNDASRGWGTVGSNGGKVTFTADKQTLKGKITVDEISTLDMSMADGTTYTGAINSDGDAGEVTVTLDDSSTWTLTADSYVTSFDGDLSNIIANGHTLYVNGTAVN